MEQDVKFRTNSVSVDDGPKSSLNLIPIGIKRLKTSQNVERSAI